MLFPLCYTAFPNGPSYLTVSPRVCELGLSAVSGSLWPQAPLSMGILQARNRSALPLTTTGHLPDPRIEPASLVSPAFAVRFFTTWEVPPGKLLLSCILFTCLRVCLPSSLISYPHTACPWEKSGPYWFLLGPCMYNRPSVDGQASLNQLSLSFHWERDDHIL